MGNLQLSDLLSGMGGRVRQSGTRAVRFDCLIGKNRRHLKAATKRFDVAAQRGKVDIFLAPDPRGPNHDPGGDQTQAGTLDRR